MKTGGAQATIRSMILTAALLLLAGAGWPSMGQAAGPSFVLILECEAGETLYLRSVEAGRSVILSGKGLRLKLPQVEAASGARYSDGRTTVWLKGDEALVVRGGVRRRCRAKIYGVSEGPPDRTPGPAPLRPPAGDTPQR